MPYGQAVSVSPRALYSSPPQHSPPSSSSFLHHAPLSINAPTCCRYSYDTVRGHGREDTAGFADAIARPSLPQPTDRNTNPAHASGYHILAYSIPVSYQSSIRYCMRGFPTEPTGNGRREPPAPSPAVIAAQNMYIPHSPAAAILRPPRAQQGTSAPRAKAQGLRDPSSFAPRLPTPPRPAK